MRAAFQMGHKVLYHYEKFHPEWLSSTLREQKVHCSNPANLNDPWDCKPWYDSASVESPAAIEQFIIWLRSIAKERPSRDVESAFENRLRTDPAFRSKFVEGFSTSNQAVILHRRIYCLTPDPYSTLMWSHYGDNHRGICLEFDLDNDVFRNAWEVTYASAYPTWVPHRMAEAAETMLFTKSDAWAYEKEFRVVMSPNYVEGHALKPDGDFIKLPPGALNAVVVGCRGDYTAVAEIVRQTAPGIAVKRIVQVANRYRLTVEGVTLG